MACMTTHIVLGWVEEEVCYLLQTTALSVRCLFEKCVSAQSSENNVDDIKNNHPVSSLPLLRESSVKQE